MSSGLSFDLSIDPNPRFVSVVRRFVEEAFERLLPDPDAVYRVSMVAHELLENAAKYSMGGKALLRVAMNTEPEYLQVTLSLINKASAAHIERLRLRIGAINDAGDPFHHYQKLMRETAHSTDESGLGLARIRAEGEMGLGVEIKGDTVAIIASARVPRTKEGGD